MIALLYLKLIYLSTSDSYRLPSNFLPRSFSLLHRTSHGLADHNYQNGPFLVCALFDYPPDLAGLWSSFINLTWVVLAITSVREKSFESATNLPSERRASHRVQKTINEEYLTSSSQSFTFTL